MRTDTLSVQQRSDSHEATPQDEPKGFPQNLPQDERNQQAKSLTQADDYARRHPDVMPCYRPIQGYRARDGRGITFNPSAGYRDLPVQVSCGQCIGCRLEKSRQWAVRCMHEAQMHKENSFLTLTYDDKHLPPDGSLRKKDFQDFMKRLRKKFRPRKVRYLHCGEYGENTHRPHYHALLFGLGFPDEEVLSRADGRLLRSSVILEKLWGQGFCTIGDVTFESAAYVARYALKKVTGPAAKEHYKTLNPETGEITEIEPEYITMSRRPGIGAEWYSKFKADVYPEDELVTNGHPQKPPRFYDTLLEKEEPETLEAIKRRRIAEADKWSKDQTPERLEVREKVTQARTKQKKGRNKI